MFVRALRCRPSTSTGPNGCRLWVGKDGWEGGRIPYIRPDSVSLNSASLLACDNSARGTIQSAFGQAVYPCCSFRSSRRALSLIVMEVSPTTIVDGDGGRRCSRQTKLTLSSGSSVSRRTKRLLCNPSGRFPVFIQKVRPSTDSDTWNLNNKTCSNNTSHRC